MDRDTVREAVRSSLEGALADAVAAAEGAQAEATHGESRAENKYDTRGLEASYLAAGQAQRVVELRRALGMLQGSGSDVVGLGSLVRTDPGGWYFVALAGGGLVVQVEGEPVRVVTPASPLGQSLLGRAEGEVVEAAGRVLTVEEVQ